MPEIAAPKHVADDLFQVPLSQQFVDERHSFRHCVVEKHTTCLRVVLEHQDAGQSRVFNRLNRVEHTDDRQVTAEGDIIANST